MGIISWLILGLVAGFIGSKIVGKSGQGFWLDIALGIVGAIVGGFLFSELLGTEGITGLNIWSMIDGNRWLLRGAVRLSCAAASSLKCFPRANLAHCGAAKLL